MKFLFLSPFCVLIMKGIYLANRIFTVLQFLWFILWLSAMIWAYIKTTGTVAGRSIRGDVTSLRLQVANVLFWLAAAVDDVQKMRWKGLVPLAAIQLIIGLFATLEVWLYSENLSMMRGLWEFTLAIGVYQLVLLLASLIFYGVHWYRLRHNGKDLGESLSVGASLRYHHLPRIK